MYRNQPWIVVGLAVIVLMSLSLGAKRSATPAAAAPEARFDCCWLDMSDFRSVNALQARLQSEARGRELIQVMFLDQAIPWLDAQGLPMKDAQERVRVAKAVAFFKQ